mmetsp:Transcript_22704/g.89798  ORF Transcript_22704/g.89798 Transcript_22704/m.89798 type:complete len:430 (-) Transcript_22704:132-1421(-)
MLQHELPHGLVLEDLAVLSAVDLGHAHVDLLRPFLAVGQRRIGHRAVARPLLALQHVLLRVFRLVSHAALALQVRNAPGAVEYVVSGALGGLGLLEEEVGLCLEVDAVDGVDPVHRRRLEHLRLRAHEVVLVVVLHELVPHDAGTTLAEDLLVGLVLPLLRLLVQDLAVGLELVLVRDIGEHPGGGAQAPAQENALLREEERLKPHAVSRHHCTQELGGAEPERAEGDPGVNVVGHPLAAELLLHEAAEVVHHAVAETVRHDDHLRSVLLHHGFDDVLHVREVSVALLQSVRGQTPVVRHGVEVDLFDVASILEHLREGAEHVGQRVGDGAGVEVGAALDALHGPQLDAVRVRHSVLLEDHVADPAALLVVVHVCHDTVCGSGEVAALLLLTAEEWHGVPDLVESNRGHAQPDPLSNPVIVGRFDHLQT